MFFLYIFFFNVLEFCVLKCKRSSKAVENKSHKILQKAADRWKALTEAKEKSKKKNKNKQPKQQTSKVANFFLLRPQHPKKQRRQQRRPTAASVALATTNCGKHFLHTFPLSEKIKKREALYNCIPYTKKWFDLISKLVFISNHSYHFS